MSKGLFPFRPGLMLSSTCIHPLKSTPSLFSRPKPSVCAGRRRRRRHFPPHAAGLRYSFLHPCRHLAAAPPLPATQIHPRHCPSGYVSPILVSGYHLSPHRRASAGYSLQVPLATTLSMDGIPYYGDFIRSMDDSCQRCIVCIRIHPVGKPTDLSVGTGIVIASADKTCFVMTSSTLFKNKKGRVGRVVFSDGTIGAIDWDLVRVRNEVSVFPIFSDRVHWGTVNFSENEATEGQRVFSSGYNSNPPTRRYISGNLVCGAVPTGFVHGCSTGKNGHHGSAVFNETHQLVGMNFLYTRSSGISYCVDEESTAPGGLVSALDLKKIVEGLQLAYPTGEKNLQETLQSMEDLLRSYETMSGRG